MSTGNVAVTKIYCAVTGDDVIKLCKACSKSSSLKSISTSSNTAHLRFVKCKNPSLIRYMKRPGVAISTSKSCSRLSNCVFCRKPPVATIDLNGTPCFEIERQFLKT
uniref:Uncharacterized protein n=1 Tax=Opuntia streptacantha TaxID=393608 RepID=A0A7C9A133_OPUST